MFLYPMKRIAMLAAVVPLLVFVLAGQAGAASPACEEMRERVLRGGGGASGLYVLDAGSGRAVCALSPKRRRSLASNMKLFTTSTALARLGADAQISTGLLTDGRVDQRGVLHGSLYLQGGGDPALGTPAFYGRFLGGLGTNLFGLTRQLRAAGVRRVTGRLYADDTIFDRLRGVADSGYATSSYIGPLSGLAFNSGYRDARGSGFASDPAKIAASNLLRSLRLAGVAIRAGVALGATPLDAKLLASVHSPTIERLAEATNVPSNNFYAEMLIKLLGARFGVAGSTSAGADVVERFARSHLSGVRAVDGSGLTRGNRASPLQVVRLLDAMRNTTVADAFIQGLALSSREGTVDDRMHGTAAEARCRTKTG
ncbi:MAG TPA: D-alanyl-D-alanine carboxypeptidase, partial [Solirubrobacterales bacterium]